MKSPLFGRCGVALAVAVVLAALAGILHAAIPDQNGVIHGTRDGPGARRLATGLVLIARTADGGPIGFEHRLEDLQAV